MWYETKAPTSGRKVAEGVFEKHFGYPLSGAHPVHHFDYNRKNNANTNLVICEDRNYHGLLHRRQRALRLTGDPSIIERRPSYPRMKRNWRDAPDSPDLVQRQRLMRERMTLLANDGQ